MSDDLISRKALLEKAKDYFISPDGALRLIESQPTAYDVDKVVGKLEERKKYLLKDFVLEEKAEEVKERTMARINEIDGLIEIIKSGGVEND